ncbi:MAG: hypothetical protein KKF56_02485 [Nanoarchaeota archaeon]|nr:hypothetical protein [Nanoarchaeota archaeon]
MRWKTASLVFLISVLSTGCIKETKIKRKWEFNPKVYRLREPIKTYISPPEENYLNKRYLI